MNNQPAPNDVAPQVGTSPSRVHVIEENEDSRYLLRTLLGLNGYGVVEVENDAQCVALAQESPPDLIILNISLPIADGLSMLRQMRQHALLQGIPIIVTSAYAVLTFQEEVLRTGSQAFFAKPIHLDGLLHTIRHCLHPNGRSH